ncbi:hypothetical protein CASFOL_014420 [Castilleja foliolosa]|uniref:Protein argonaute N-terminal domain-containing protein n=1 Tax=Castilleja foliolosa TaxID=1961234 RepID=A0ABD3DMS9_9LAMI
MNNEILNMLLALKLGPKDAAFQIVNDELMMDGNPRLNLASFVTTWMGPECKYAYDGEKSLFTVGALPRNKMEFTVVLDDITSTRNTGNSSPVNVSTNDGDKKRMKRPYHSKTLKVELSFAVKIPMQVIANALRGQESENSMEALRVLVYVHYLLSASVSIFEAS